MGDAQKKHTIVTQFEKAFDLSEEYSLQLKNKIFTKGFIGKEANEKNINDLVKFLNSKEVASLLREKLGSKAGKYSDSELLERYGIPKHTIKELVGEYKTITEGILLNLVESLTARLHGELTSNHPTAIANLAYDKGEKAAQAVLKDLYISAGGDKYYANNKKAITDIKEPSKFEQKVAQLYQNRELHQEKARTSEKIKKPLPQYQKAV